MLRLETGYLLASVSELRLVGEGGDRDEVRNLVGVMDQVGNTGLGLAYGSVGSVTSPHVQGEM